MTVRSIGTALGISPAIVVKFRKRGMPIDQGAEAAREWLQNNRQPRGRPKGFTLRVRQASPGPAERNAPTASLEAPPAIPEKAEVRGSTPEQLLERLQKIEQAAYEQAERTLQENPSDAQSVIRTHREAARNLLDARGLFLAAAERERRLVSGSRVRRYLAERAALVMNLVRAMPRQMAPRVNPGAVKHAERELSSWVQNQFLKRLHAGNADSEL